MTMRRVCAAILLALACLAALPASGALAQGPKADCKHGGYANYLDPATGDAFTNQGKCVRFVAKGGTLEPVPVEYPVTIAGVTTEGNGGPLNDPEGNSVCNGTRVNLYGYGTHTVVLTPEWVPSFGATPITYADVFFADGFASLLMGNQVNGHPITVTVDGQDIGTVTPDCGPAVPAPEIVVSGGWAVDYSDDPTTAIGGDACSFRAVGVTDTTNPDPNEDHTVTVLRNGEVFYSGLTLLPGNFGDYVVPNGTTTTLIVDGVVLGSWLSQPGCPLTASDPSTIS